MLTRDRLTIFESFQVDHTLPKHSSGEIKKTLDFVTQYMARKGGEINITQASGDWDIMIFPDQDAKATKKLGLWRRLGARLGAWFRPRPPALPAPEMSVEEFFTNVKNSAAELVIVKERAAGYERALQNALKAGQLALVEQLQLGLNAYKMETQLVAMGLSKYVTEESVVQFYKQSEKGLRLDWVRNFARQIPESVVAVKSRADDLGIFDNYVVLHYDPEAKAFAETEQEKADRIRRERDPILFGVIKGKRVLYFVGDWIDEYCDLTLDEFAEVMGRDTVHDLRSLPDPYREAASISAVRKAPPAPPTLPGPPKNVGS